MITHWRVESERVVHWRLGQLLGAMLAATLVTTSSQPSSADRFDTALERFRLAEDVSYLIAGEWAARSPRLERPWLYTRRSGTYVAASAVALLGLTLLSIARGRRAPRTVRPLGHGLLLLAEFVFRRRTFEDVFESAILDVRAEHHEYLAAGRKWKARWIGLQANVLVAELVFKHGLGKVFDLVRQVVFGVGTGG